MDKESPFRPTRISPPKNGAWSRWKQVEIRNRRSGQGKSIPPYKDFTAAKWGMLTMETGGDLRSDRVLGGDATHPFHGGHRRREREWAQKETSGKITLMFWLGVAR